MNYPINGHPPVRVSRWLIRLPKIKFTNIGLFLITEGLDKRYPSNPPLDPKLHRRRAANAISQILANNEVYEGLRGAEDLDILLSRRTTPKQQLTNRAYHHPPIHPNYLNDPNQKQPINSIQSN